MRQPHTANHTRKYTGITDLLIVTVIIDKRNSKTLEKQWLVGNVERWGGGGGGLMPVINLKTKPGNINGH